MCAMNAAGWSPSDPVTLMSSLKIAGSVVFHRPYLHAPVSPLFFDGRRQDFAFEKASGGSASRRHHVRFWKALDKRRRRAAGLARGGGLRQRRRRQPLHRADHPPHRARHRRRARSSDPRSRRRQARLADLLGQRRRADAVRPQRRRRPVLSPMARSPSPTSRRDARRARRRPWRRPRRRGSRRRTRCSDGSRRCGGCCLAESTPRAFRCSPAHPRPEERCVASRLEGRSRAGRNHCLHSPASPARQRRRVLQARGAVVLRARRFACGVAQAPRSAAKSPKPMSAFPFSLASNLQMRRLSPRWRQQYGRNARSGRASPGGDGKCSSHKQPPDLAHAR